MGLQAPCTGQGLLHTGHPAGVHRLLQGLGLLLLLLGLGLGCGGRGGQGGWESVDARSQGEGGFERGVVAGEGLRGKRGAGR